MNCECLKDYVISQVKGFYCDDLYFENDEAIYIESEAYKQEVRTLDKQLENASLKWFMESRLLHKKILIIIKRYGSGEMRLIMNY